MSFVQRLAVPITTATTGAATAYSPVVTGKLMTVIYTPHGSTPFATTVDFTVTVNGTGEAVLSKTNVAAAFVNAPRQATHDTSGVASLYAAGGDAVEDHIAVAGDQFKCVVAQGGSAKVGTLTFIVA